MRCGANWKDSEAAKRGPQRGGGCSRGCRTYVDVQPQVVLLADVGDLVDGVERTVDGGAGRGVDEQRHVTLRM